jgi:hypothetical protein
MSVLAIAMVAAVAQRGPQPKPLNEMLKPAIVFYKTPGGWSRGKNQLVFIAWPNGQVIWREPQSEFGPASGAIDSGASTYYKGRVPATKIQQELNRLKKTGAQQVKGWLYIFPDAESSHRIARLNGQRIDLGASAPPPVNAPSRQPQQSWQQGRKLWLAMGRTRDHLIPKLKNRTHPPADSQLQGWINP